MDTGERRRAVGPVLGPVAAALQRAGIRKMALLVAVSGGIDSMVLLDTLFRLRELFSLQLHIAHVHHGLRGHSADRDAVLVEATARRLGLPCTVVRLVPGALSRGVSVQMWARDARYRALEDRRQAAGAAWTVTAHTRNDQAETVLMNLLRGTGPRGLAGMRMQRDQILRPLLAVTRDTVAAYAAEHQIPFRDDPSNRSDKYRRNRVRKHLLPFLAAYNPRIVDTLAEVASELREDEEVLDRSAGTLADTAVRASSTGVRIRVALLADAPPAMRRRVLQEAFRRASHGQHGLTRRHLTVLCSLLQKPGNARLPGGLVARRQRETLVIGAAASHDGYRAAAALPEVPLQLGVWTQFGRVQVRLRPGRGRTPAGNPCREVLGPAVLDAPLRLRGWRPGDRFQPLGLRGEKKLQDFFVDEKIPKADRDGIPLLFAGDSIAWVVGHRIAEPFRWRGERRACLAECRLLRPA